MIRLSSLTLLLVGIGLPFSTAAQDTPPESDREWGIPLTPYALFASQSTDVAGQKLRQSFTDLASLTNFGFQMKTTAYWRSVLFTVDWTSGLPAESWHACARKTKACPPAPGSMTSRRAICNA